MLPVRLPAMALAGRPKGAITVLLAECCLAGEPFKEDSRVAVPSGVLARFGRGSRLLLLLLLLMLLLLLLLIVVGGCDCCWPPTGPDVPLLLACCCLLSLLGFMLTSN